MPKRQLGDARMHTAISLSPLGMSPTVLVTIKKKRLDRLLKSVTEYTRKKKLQIWSQQVAHEDGRIYIYRKQKQRVRIWPEKQCERFF